MSIGVISYKQNIVFGVVVYKKGSITNIQKYTSLGLIPKRWNGSEKNGTTKILRSE